MVESNPYKNPPKGFKGFTNHLARILIIGLFTFEFSNWIGLLDYQLEFTWVGLALTTLAVYLIVASIEYYLLAKYGIYLHWATWPMVAIMLLFDFLGDFFYLYERWLPYDRIAHAFSGIFLVPLLYSFYNRVSWAKKWRYPLVVNLVLAIGSNVFLAVLYEIEEYSEDIIYHTSRLGNGFDTANDLLMNLVGALIVSTMIYYITKEPQAVLVESPVLASREVVEKKSTNKKSKRKSGRVKSPT